MKPIFQVAINPEARSPNILIAVAIVITTRGRKVTLSCTAFLFNVIGKIIGL